MPLATILKKASTYMLGSENEDSDRADDSSSSGLDDNEALFCKNNVCVHPPTIVRNDQDILHYPGYLTVTSRTFIDQHTTAKRHTLLLTWIPNSTLRKCPAAAIDPKGNTIPAPAATTQTSSPKIQSIPMPGIVDFKFNSKNPFIDLIQQNGNTSDYSGSVSMSSSSDRIERDSCVDSEDMQFDKPEEHHSTVASTTNTTAAAEEDVPPLEDDHKVRQTMDREEEEVDKDLISELEPLLDDDQQQKQAQKQAHLKPQQSVTSVNITIADPHIRNQDLSPTETAALMLNVPISHSISSLSQMDAETMFGGGGDHNTPSSSSTCAAWMTPEFLAYKHNLSFPESNTSSPLSQRKATIASSTAQSSPSSQPFHKCRRFSVDLSQMRSLRLFFSDQDCTSGQLVIASRESQYKILHFHHGGLDHLAQVLHQWHCLLHNTHLAPTTTGNNGDLHTATGAVCNILPYRHFMVCRPEVRKSELHPEEGNVVKITTDYFYGTLLNKRGQIEDDLTLRKCVFFGGLEKKLRKTVWPFLLHCYSLYSTFEDRATLADIRRQEYEELTKRRLYSMSPEEQAHFWKTVHCVIEKDVVRTDRGNPFFAGENNPNIEIMKNILLNYAFHNPTLSYTQGMSDLLAPVLCEIKNEAETFWCFVGLMQRAVFVCQPTNNDMDKNLSFLRELIRVMLPQFHGHLLKYSNALELLFCHRWILLCFKREFTEAVAIRMWEACWSNYLTDYFHLFLCLGILAVYADDVTAQNLSADEMLLYFSSLAMYMDGQLILRKARGLLHQFRQLPKVPCTLSTLCKRCGPGMWDSGHHPAIECVGHLDNESCAFAFD